MSSKHNEALILQEACDWIAAVNSDGASEEERMTFEQWLVADPAHKAAYERLETIWCDVAALSDLAPLIEAEPQAPEAAGRAERMGGIRALASRVFARPLAAGATFAALAAVIGVVWLSRPPEAPERYETRLAESVEVFLPDGSAVVLGPKSVVEASFGGGDRRVTLASGEAYFRVAPDRAHPFRVVAGQSTIEVVGTEFNVALLPDESRIAVAEGIVAVNGGGDAGSPASRTLRPGQAVVVKNGVVGDALSIDASIVGAWRSGRLVYKDAVLPSVIADFNRYSARAIELAPDVDPALSITGSFRTTEIDAVVKAIVAAHGLESVPNAKGGRTLRKKRAE